MVEFEMERGGFGVHLQYEVELVETYNSMRTRT